MGDRKLLEECNDMIARLFGAIRADVPEAFRETLAQAAGLWQFAPFKVGDRVVLFDPPKINKEDSWGWMPYRHLFVEGAVATVRAVEWRHYSPPAMFVVLLTFDDDADQAHFTVGAFRCMILNTVPPSTSTPTTDET